jgi:hypothetical protein
LHDSFFISNLLKLKQAAEMLEPKVRDTKVCHPEGSAAVPETPGHRRFFDCVGRKERGQLCSEPVQELGSVEGYGL